MHKPGISAILAYMDRRVVITSLLGIGAVVGGFALAGLIWGNNDSREAPELSDEQRERMMFDPAAHAEATGLSSLGAVELKTLPEPAKDIIGQFIEAVQARNIGEARALLVDPGGSAHLNGRLVTLSDLLQQQPWENRKPVEISVGSIDGNRTLRAVYVFRKKEAEQGTRLTILLNETTGKIRIRTFRLLEVFFHPTS